MALVDLKLFDSSGAGTLTEDAWAPDGITGADKVAARVVYALLTPLGSIPGRPNDGTGFLATLQNFRSEFDVYAAFAAAMPGVFATVTAAEVDSADDSEKFGSCRLMGLNLTGDVLTISVNVTAADGSKPTTETNFTVTL